MFNILDGIIVLILLIQSIRWAKQGFIQGVFPLVGFWLGVLGGAWLTPHVINLLEGSLEKLAVTLALIITVALLGGAIGELIGSSLSQVSRRFKLRTLDSVLGAVFSVGLGLFIIWLLAAVLVTGPFQGVNTAIRQSVVLQTLNDRLPPAPDTISRLGGLINQADFPRVFTGLGPRPVEPVDLPDSPAVQSAAQAAGAATVRLESSGCGGIVNGSGFMVAPNVVMTNAHVIAGIDDPVIVDQAGSHAGTPIYFDPARDIALVRAQGLAGTPLSLVENTVDRGTRAVTLGYPEGGRLDAEPTGVLQYINASGRDIYNQQTVTRPVYELQAEVVSGNSGGPVVTPQGSVIGMVFARSISDQNTGYAVTSAALQPVVAENADDRSSVDTAQCAS
jgi:S1-C subfamily serine protease